LLENRPSAFLITEFKAAHRAANNKIIMKRFLTITAAVVIATAAICWLGQTGAQAQPAPKNSASPQPITQSTTPAEDMVRYDQLARAQEERARRVDTLLVRQEKLMDKQEAAFTRFQKILDTWEQQQKQYQQYLDTLKK
jgi:hypothetical protein